MACFLCRSRKVLCDRSRPECHNCQRLGVKCPGYQRQHEHVSRQEMLVSAEAIYRASGIEKRRVGSCAACRVSKNRCTKTRPACRRCLARNIECIYNTKNGTSKMSADLQLDDVPIPRAIESRSDASILPEDPAMRLRFYNAYFDRVHPLRCLAFIHKPSFMYALDRGSLAQEYEEPLLLIVCALGSRQLSLDSAAPLSDELSLRSQTLAEKARNEVLSQLHNPTSQQLMTMVLLCEYASRTDQHAMAFILVGCVFRQLRLLGLDTTANYAELSPVSPEKEVENRLLWACYSTDVLLASGVDKNSSWRDDFPRISLPCSDADFLCKTPCQPNHLAHVLHNPSLIRGLDIPTLNTILIHLRTKVLRCIRTTHAGDGIWNPSSAFMVILQELEDFYSHLPAKFGLSEINMYMHKDQHILSAVFFLHLVYHAAVCDLSRILLPGFSFPLATAFRNAPTDFISQCQQRCKFHAEEISNIIRKGISHGRIAFDDPIAAEPTFESTKIQIIYSATVADASHCQEITMNNIRSNLELLRMLSLGKRGSSPHIRALLSLCSAFDLYDIVDEWQGPEALQNNMPAEVTGSADIHHLSTMAPFRRARSETSARRSSTNTATFTSEQTREQHQVHPDSAQLPIIPSNQTSLTSFTPFGACGLPDPISGDIPQRDSPRPRMIQGPIQDYIQAAEEMSNFLTWDTTEWWNFNGPIPI